MSARRSTRISAAAASAAAKLAPSQVEDVDVPNRVANISRKRKIPAQNAESRETNPSTPKKKRTSNSTPPATPTPAAIGLMTIPYNSGHTDVTTPPPVNRLVVLNGTNAPLVTPETHRLLAQKPIDQVSPSKAPNISNTTEDVLQKALAHLLEVEPKLKPVINKHPCNIFSPEGLSEEIDPFRSLASSIISQQVSIPYLPVKQVAVGLM
jgi:DNA-3-methyladenine glycosylase II